MRPTFARRDCQEHGIPYHTGFGGKTFCPECRKHSLKLAAARSQLRRLLEGPVVTRRTKARAEH